MVKQEGTRYIGGSRFYFNELNMLSYNNIDTTIQKVYDMLKTSFPNKSEQQLKSEIASIIYSQSDIQSVYYKEFNNSKNMKSVKKSTRNTVLTKEKTLPEFPNQSITDILNDLIDKMNDDDLGVNKGTIGIWMASGIAFDYMSDEMKALNDNMDELTKLYDFLANDYDNVLNQVYEKAFAENGGDAAAAKAARDRFQGQLKILESIVLEGDVAKGVKRAMKLMVKKWLVWYIPIFPWPMGHWRTYSKENIKGDLTDMESYADPIDDPTLPLALAVSWIDMDQLPVSRPSDVDENLFPQKDIPESVKKNNLESEWIQAVIWFDEQDIVQDNNNGKFDEDNIRNLYVLFTDNITWILGSPKVYGNENVPAHGTEEFVSQFTNRERRLELERWLNNWMYINNDPKNTEIIPEGGYWQTGYSRVKRASISRHIDEVYRYGGSQFIPEFLRPYDYTPFKLTN